LCCGVPSDRRKESCSSADRDRTVGGEARWIDGGAWCLVLGAWVVVCGGCGGSSGGSSSSE